MIRRAKVYYRKIFAGILSEMPGGGYYFAYDPEYLENGKAISVTLPLQAEAFESEGIFPFFAGLIPEGWYLHIVAPTIKVDEHDTFGLLIKTCADCIGAVSIEELKGEQN